MTVSQYRYSVTLQDKYRLDFRRFLESGLHEQRLVIEPRTSRNFRLHMKQTIDYCFLSRLNPSWKSGVVLRATMSNKKEIMTFKFSFSSASFSSASFSSASCFGLRFRVLRASVFVFECFVLFSTLLYKQQLVFFCLFLMLQTKLLIYI